MDVKQHSTKIEPDYNEIGWVQQNRKGQMVYMYKGHMVYMYSVCVVYMYSVCVCVDLSALCCVCALSCAVCARAWCELVLSGCSFLKVTVSINRKSPRDRPTVARRGRLSPP